MPVDGHTFNYLIRGDAVFLVVADEEYGRPIPFACAKRIADVWEERFGAAGARVADPMGMQRAFG